MYAEAYLPIAVNQTFSYLIPENLEKEIKRGSLVRLPFGNRFAIGYIDNIIDNQEYSGTIKPIDSLISNIAVDQPEIQELINWMHHYYLAPKGIIVKNIFPFLFSKNSKSGKKEKEIKINQLGRIDLDSNKIKGLSRKKILEYLANLNSFVNLKKIKNDIDISDSSFNLF